MSHEPRKTADLESTRKALLAGALKHARTAALAASLVPLAQVAVAPMAVSAQCQPTAIKACPTTSVPEPATLLLMAPAAAAVLLLRRRRK